MSLYSRFLITVWLLASAIMAAGVWLEAAR